MALFDTKTFLYNAGRGESPTTALGAAFGMPSCLVNLGTDLLRLLPRSILDPMRNSTQDGITAADDAIKSSLASLGFLDGIIEYDTETGTFRLVTDSSRNGLDNNGGDTLNSIGGFLGAALFAAGFAGRLYNNYESTVNQINDIRDCIQGYSDYLNYTGGAKATPRSFLSSEQYEDVLSQYDIIKSDIDAATEFRDQAFELLTRIDAILEERNNDPSLEPVFRADYAEILSGTELQVEPLPMPEKVEQIFRLKFGPPISKSGKFILSLDGLYYDSQTSGIEPALLEIENRKSSLQNNILWTLKQDPNIGGRGKEITLESIKSYVNTLLDPGIINESNFINQYYDKDELLGNIIGERNRRVFDLSSQISDLRNAEASEILISNLKQVMLSESSHYQQKINKRKKQIELAVLMPSIYKNEILYQPGDKIPVNDFSYLQGINYSLDIEKQKSLVLNQSEVSGVVLPIEVKYVKQIDNPEKIVLDHLLINNVGTGEVVANGSGTMAPQLTLTDTIETDGLVALYNLLKFKMSDPSSLEFKLNNSSELDDRLDAQLVGESEVEIFDRGVGIAYLHGITKHSQTSTSNPTSVGSFIKLPEQRELQDLLFNKKGGTFEAWVYAPSLNQKEYFNDGNVSGLYRLILANENTGTSNNYTAQSDINRLKNDKSSNTHKGMIFGFTIDQRLTSDADASNDPLANPIDKACLVLTPTQAFNSSSVGFINKSFDQLGRCYSLSSAWYGMRFPIFNSVNGVSLSKCTYEFCQISFTLDPEKDRVSLYCDGQLLTASSYLDVFGIDVTKELPTVPTLKLNNSFEYNSTSMLNVSSSKLKGGPKLGPYFTPWIVGGGYTDGMQTGNFLGTQYGGKISGLRGYVGGLKIYNKALAQKQVLKNFNSSKNFFKNINLNNYFNFKVIGTDDVSESASFRFYSTFSDNENIYVGSDNINSSCTLWSYNDEGNWSQINLPGSANNAAIYLSAMPTIGSIKKFDDKLFITTIASAGQTFGAGVFTNSGTGWSSLYNSPALLDGGFRALTRTANGNIYAAGTASYVWKYDGAWNEIYVSNNFDILNTHWTDLIPSGNTIYAACSRLFTSGNVYSYDGTSWTKLTEDGFGDPHNLGVSKLCIYDNKLYAATINLFNGTEIWKYDNNVWTKINESGFGTNYNYHSVDFKVINDRLVVSTRNPTGGQIWSYTEATGWRKELVDTNVIYTYYLIESLKDKNYLIGGTIAKVIPRKRGTLITPKQRIEKGLYTWPDESFAGIPIGNGRYRFFAPNALFTAVTEGTFDNPIETMVSPSSFSLGISSLNLGASTLTENYGWTRGQIYAGWKGSPFSGDLIPDGPLSFSAVSANIIKIGSFSGGSLFESKPFGLKYSAGSQPYLMPDTSNVALLVHNEFGYYSGAPSNPLPGGAGWAGSIGMIVSKDGGLTFSDTGFHITSNESSGGAFNSSSYVASSVASPSTIAYADMNLGSFVASGDYMYIYYDLDKQKDGSQPLLCLARCSLSDFHDAIINVSAPKFYKYYNGSFTEPIKGGRASDLFKYSVGNKGAGTVLYSNKLNEFLAIYGHGRYTVDPNQFYEFFDVSANQWTGGFIFNTAINYSNDGFNFSFPEIVQIQKIKTSAYKAAFSDKMDVGRIENELKLINWNGLSWFNDPNDSRNLYLEYTDTYIQEIESKNRNYNIVNYQG